MKRMKPFAVLLVAMVPTAPVAVALAAEPAAPPAKTPAKSQGKADGPLSVVQAMRHAGYRHKHRKLVRAHFSLVRSLHGKVSYARTASVHAWSVHHLRSANRTLHRRLAATRPTGALTAIAAVRVARQPPRHRRRRCLPRQVPVRLRHVGLGRRQGRSRRRAGGRAGPPREDPLRASRFDVPGPSAGGSQETGTRGQGTGREPFPVPCFLFPMLAAWTPPLFARASRRSRRSPT